MSKSEYSTTILKFQFEKLKQLYINRLSKQSKSSSKKLKQMKNVSQLRLVVETRIFGLSIHNVEPFIRTTNPGLFQVQDTPQTIRTNIATRI